MGKSFYDLEVWRIGFDLLKKIYKISENFPKFEQYALGSQLIRSANSIIANIAEAHGRYYYLDKIRVLYTSRAEIQETRSHLRVAFGQSYIDELTLKKLDAEYESLTRKLNMFISYLSNQSKS